MLWFVCVCVAYLIRWHLKRRAPASDITSGYITEMPLFIMLMKRWCNPQTGISSRETHHKDFFVPFNLRDETAMVSFAVCFNDVILNLQSSLLFNIFSWNKILDRRNTHYFKICISDRLLLSYTLAKTNDIWLILVWILIQTNIED